MKPACPVRLKKGSDEAVRAGMPWIYSGDMIASSEHLLMPRGGLVSIETHKGQRIGTGYLNPDSTIACRVLTLENEPIDVNFFKKRMESALAHRKKHMDASFCRLIHSEADFLPGLLVDRFGDIAVVQSGTAGMDQLMPLWLAALEDVISPRAIVLRNDTSARAREGLERTVEVIKGTVPELVELEENGCTYLADLLRGQKTGWFYDQRDNRRMIAELSPGKTVADIYSHSGGFGLLAAKAGAEVTLVDSSVLALDLAQKAAALNKVTVSCLQGDAFGVMEALHREGRRFDIVLADPPAFVKSKKDIASGMKGYAKVAQGAAKLVKPGGLLFVASCSHHATRAHFNQSVQDGMRKAGVEGDSIRQTGASADHPRHPKLAQSEYLKGILIKTH